MRLDHVSYAVSNHELVDTVQRLGQQLGGSFVDGGRHPRFGTRNFVLPLQGGTYVEVVAALDHPASDKAPFGQAVKRRAEDGGGWLGWVVSVDDIAPFEQRLGRPATDGHRVRPDGFDLTWKQIGVQDVIEDASLPFFIQWTSDPAEHPSLAGPAHVSAVACELAGDKERIRGWLGGEVHSPIEKTDITWVDGEVPGLVAVHFRTTHGDVVRVD
ncbi:MAG: VOC family protein [Actinomycetales bacterium]|nr:VOC family protein [Actinomycetales bacterium]